MGLGSLLVTDVLGQELSAASDSLSGILTIIPKGYIGGIAIDATLEEVLTDSMQVTEHPVQTGAAITDHSYTRLPEIVMRCGWSNASPNALLSSVASSFTGGQVTVSDYVGSVYSQLIALMQSGTVFTVMGSIRMYTSMLLTSVALTRDSKTSQALMLTATLRQILIVSTSEATLPPIGDQANPQDTAESVNAGPQSLTESDPSPGSSYYPTPGFS